MNKTNTSGTSWVVIIIAFIVFWPVGIFLLLRKLANDRSAQLKSGGTFTVVGIILLLLGLSWLGGRNYMAGFFMIIGGVYLLNKASAMNKHSKRYKQYIPLIVNQHITSLDTIATVTGIPAPTVEQDLKYMVDKGFFPGARYDANLRQLIMFQPVAPQPAFQPAPAYAQPAAAPVPQQRVVACKNCGANNTVYGATGACEYCGSAVQ